MPQQVECLRPRELLAYESTDEPSAANFATRFHSAVDLKQIPPRRRESLARQYIAKYYTPTVQKLTREGGHSSAGEREVDEEDWTRAKALAETVEDHELLDPMLPPDRLLYRLFHEEQVRAFRAIPLESYCSCSRARVEELLKRFSAEDLADMVVDGEVWVTCEFCNSRYCFDPASFADA